MIITKICGLYSPLRIFLPVSFVMFLLRLRSLSLYLPDFRAVYEYERSTIHDFCPYFHDGPYFRTDLPDAF